MALIFQPLLQYGPNLDLQPNLADSYSISDDNLTITFKLHPGITWADGQPLTARDVAFTFKQMLHPKYTGSRTGSFLRLSGAQAYRDGKVGDVAGIQVIDDLTVAFRVDQPYAPLLYNVATWPIAPEHVYGSISVDEIATNPVAGHPIGVGPFQLKEYRPGEYAELVRDDNYFKGKPHVNRIIFHIVNPDVGIGQFAKGDLDAITVTPKDLPTVQVVAGAHLWEYPDPGYQYMGVNTRLPGLSDVRVRQALAYAINRQGIVDQLLAKHGIVLNSPISPRSWASDPASLTDYPFDPNKARQLLAAAGYTEKDAQGYLVKDGKRLSFKLTFPTGDALRQQSAPIIQANLKDVGIEIILDQLGDVASLAGKVFEKQDSELWLLAWGQSPDPDPSLVWDTSDTKGPYAGATGWSDAAAVDLLHQAVQKLKPDERKPLYVQWAQIVNRDLPYVFLYAPNDMVVTSGRLQGVQVDARGLGFNAQTWWIPADQQRGE